jgi:hypothetical protein
MYIANADFVATVSLRALMVLAPNFRSLPQCGTKPQRSGRPLVDLRIEAHPSTGSVGAMLKRTGQFGSAFFVPKMLAISATGSLSKNRPQVHFALFCLTAPELV